MAYLSDELSHAGVKGMRWGVRKEEKSVSAERKAKRELKAKAFEAEAAKYDKYIAKFRSTEGKSKWQIKADADSAKSLEKLRDRAIKDAQAKRDGKMTTGQKKALIGVGVVAALVVAGTIAVKTDSGEFTQMAAKGKAFLKGEKPEFKKSALLASKMDADQVFQNVVKPINPDYGKLGTKMNCRRATFAYELRRRGMDVRATKTTLATGQTAGGLLEATSPNGPRTGSVFGLMKKYNQELKDPRGSLSRNRPLKDLMDANKGGAKVRIDGSPGSLGSKLFSTLRDQPDGSRGEVAMIWKSGGGHSIAYEIFGGKPVLFDNQTGKRYDSIEAFSGLDLNIGELGFTRLDNVELNMDYLLKWATNAN